MPPLASRIQDDSQLEVPPVKKTMLRTRGGDGMSHDPLSNLDFVQKPVTINQ